MKHLLTLLFILTLCTCVRAQEGPDQPTKPQLAIVTVSGFTGSGGTYSGQLSNWRDVYEVGYIGTSAQVGNLFADAAGRVYEVTSVTSSTAISANVVINCLSPVVGSPIGTGQAWVPLDNGYYPVAPSGDNQIGKYLQGILISHNAALSKAEAAGGAAAGYRDTVLSVAGLIVDVSFTGTAPTLTGSPGGYLLTIAEASDWRHAIATATSAAAATSANDLALQVVNENDVLDWSTVQLIDLSNNEIITAPKLEYGILIGQTSSGSQTVTTTLSGVGGLSGFILKLVR